MRLTHGAGGAEASFKRGVPGCDLSRGVRCCPIGSFLIALEVLTHLDIGVFPYAAFIFANDLEHRREYPAHGQIGPPQIGILVRIAAQVIDHRKLRLDVATLDGGTIDRIAEDYFE